MGDASGIEWTDATWNPVRGCSRVSKGCENCYAEGVARRFAGPGQPYEGLVRLTADGKPKAQWNGVVRMVPAHLADPLRWRKPRRIFVNSMSDLFHEALSDEDIEAVFGVMHIASHHTFQVLTKRPERAREWLRKTTAERCLAEVCWRPEIPLESPQGRRQYEAPAGWEWPLPNVWIGVSVEDQKTADERIPVLLDTPAALRWVSYEPALGPVAFREGSLGRGRCAVHDTDGGSFCNGCPDIVSGLDWIVVGGESGPRARPFDIEWARSTIGQCSAAGVPCFVKQLGAFPHSGTAGAGWAGSNLRGKHWRWDDACGGELAVYEAWNRKGGEPREWPPDLRVRQFPQVRS